MAEGQSFEKQHEITKPETGPEIDIESVLERGEIENPEALKGFFPFNAVRIKDDGSALFRPGDLSEVISLGSELELLAFSVDKILNFNLIPPVVGRELEGVKGTLQHRVEDSPTASRFVGWRDLISKYELLRAAVFDYIMNAKDRHDSNFLVNPGSGKIWLIDHDYFMLVGDGKATWTYLLEEAITIELTKLTEQIKASLYTFIAAVDSFVVNAHHPVVVEILEEARRRAEMLLETGEIPRKI